THTSSVGWEVLSGGGVFADSGTSTSTQVAPAFIPDSVDEPTDMVLQFTGYGSGTCSGTYATSSLTVSVDPLPEATAPATLSVCEDGSVQIIGATIQNADSLRWTHDGSDSGQLFGSDRLDPTYFPSSADAGNIVEFTLTAYGEGGCGIRTATATTSLLVFALPEIQAGPPQEVCGVSTTLDASIESVGTGSWTWSSDVAGAEVVFEDIYAPNSNVTVSEAGVYTFYWSVSNGPCLATDAVEVVFDPLPEIDAGNSEIICAVSCFDLEATALYSSATSWSVIHGNGFFEEPDQLKTSFWPEIGTVTESTTMIVQLSAEGQGQCAGETVTDTTSVRVDPLPYADAGVPELVSPGEKSIEGKHVESNNHQAINTFPEIKKMPISSTCENRAFELKGHSEHAAEVLWEVKQGDGNFRPRNHEETIFFPDPVDEITTMKLELTAYGSEGCEGLYHTDDAEVEVWPGAVVYAGEDAVICEDGVLELNEAFVDHETDFSWSSSGSGHFYPDQKSLNPVYYPSREDVSRGEVLLTLEASNEQCGSVSDHISLQMRRDPLAFMMVDQPACSGGEVEFTDLSLGKEGYITTWIWDFGDGNTKTVVFPENRHVSHVYEEADRNYEVELTVITSHGCSSSITREIYVAPSPRANFTFSEGHAGSVIRFTDLSQRNANISDPGGDIAGYFWDFGDPDSGSSNHSQSQHPAHVFEQPGVYTVQLEVTNHYGCTDLISKDIYIPEAPRLSISVLEACFGEPYEFIADMDVEADSYYWDFGDGSTSFEPQPEHIYSMPGTYEVNLMVRTDDGSELHAEPVTVNVYPPVVAHFDAPDEVCAGASAAFVDLSDTGGLSVASRTWYFGDGHFSSDENPLHQYENPGLYMVRLEILDERGCLATYAQPVQVNQSPVASFEYEGECAGQAVRFSDHSSAGEDYAQITAWHWDFGDPDSGNNSADSRNPLHVFSAPGTYEVHLTVTNNHGCTDKTLKEITVGEMPLPEFEVVKGCFGEPYAFIPEVATDVMSYSWDFGDGNYSDQQHPEHTYSRAGVYEVSLEVTYSDGCLAISDTTEISVNGPIRADFELPEQSCAGNELMFRDLSAVGEGVISVESWSWDFGDGNTSSVQHPGHVYQEEGVFEVSLVVADAMGCTDSLTKELVVGGMPETDFDFAGECPGQEVAFFDRSRVEGEMSQVNSWAWDFGDPGSGSYNTSNRKNPGHVFDNPGTYPVSLTVTTNQGCSTEMTRDVVILPAVSAEIHFEDKVCTDAPVSFTFSLDGEVDTEGIERLEWDFGDGEVTTSIDPGWIPVHHYAEPGNYTVQLQVIQQEGCVSTVSRQLQVVDPPVPVLMVSEQEVCTGQEVILTNITTQIDDEVESWELLVDGQLFGPYDYSDPSQLSYSFDSPGIKNVKLFVYGKGGCMAETSRLIQVRAGPVADFSFESGCEGEPVEFFDESRSGGHAAIVDWQWDFGGTARSGHRNPVHAFDNAGVKTVTLTVEDHRGCVSSRSRQVAIAGAPHVDAGADYSICRGDSIVLEATSKDYPGAGNDFFVWDNGRFQQGKSFVPDTSRTYVVEISDGNACLGSDSITVVVEDVPDIQVEGNDLLSCEEARIRLNAIVDARGHEWEVHWSSVQMEDTIKGDYIWIDHPGWYLAKAVTPGGCEASDSIMVEQDLQVYIPNAFRPESDLSPNQRFMPLFYACEPSDYHLVVFDRHGNEVYSTSDPEDNGWDGTIGGRRAPADTYLYYIEYDLGDGTQVKQGVVYLVR
ncbi:MAG: PKD domain-containing protein, partial [Bacteroidales bacterium]